MHSVSGHEMKTFSIVVKFLGENLEPSEISARLGAAPDWASKKGAMVTYAMPRGRTVEREATTGFWQISAATDNLECIPQAAKELLAKLNAEAAQVSMVSSQFRGQIIFTNEAELPGITLALPPELTSLIQDLGLKLFINEFA
jgi:hypothetical protein